MAAGSDIAGVSARDGRDGRPGPRRVSIRLLVVLLMLALITPATALIGYIVAQVGVDRQRQVERDGELRADEIADRLEIEFRTSATLLAVFASSGWLEEGQYRLLHQRAQRALAGTDRYLIVLDENFAQLLNTRVAFDTVLGPTSNIEAAQRILDEPGVVVTDLFEGGVAGTDVYNVMRRAILPDGGRRVLILTRNAEDLRALLGPAEPPSGWSFAILDGADQVVMREAAGEEPDAALPAACLESGWGFRAWAGAEDPQFVVTSAVDRSLWSVCVWGSAERLLARRGSYWTLFLAGTVAWSAFALAAAAVLSTALSRAVARTARVGDALDAGKPVTVGRSFIAEVDDVRQALAKAATERMRKDEKMRLMQRETAHRAKNQMALAVSLVSLSAQSATTVAELRDNVTERLRAVGRSVDVLATRHADAAPLGQLVRAQLQHFVDDGTHRLRVAGEDLLLSPPAAQSLSLVLHELATNASKYGGWSVPDGLVEVAWEIGDTALSLHWKETGCGTPGPWRDGFGTTLIDGLVRRDLGGSIERSLGEDGLTCEIVLPLDAVAATPRPA